MKANASPTKLIELPKTTPKATIPLCDPHAVDIPYTDAGADMFVLENACKCPEYSVSMSANKEKRKRHENTENVKFFSQDYLKQIKAINRASLKQNKQPSSFPSKEK